MLSCVFIIEKNPGNFSIFRFLPILVFPGCLRLNLGGDNVETLPGVQTPKGIFPSIINNRYINRKQYHCLSSKCQENGSNSFSAFLTKT